MIGRIAAQTRLEILLTLRRGESLLVSIGIPIGILAFFSVVDVLPHPAPAPVDWLVPGVLALSVVATGMVSAGISAGFERQWGVLRRLAITPLGRSGLVGAKTASVLVVVALQTGLVVLTATVLGWRADPRPFVVAGLLVLGTLAFTGVGLALAGTLRAETNLAAANGLFLVFLLLGGIVVPVETLPQVLEHLARLLPAEPLVRSLRASLTGETVTAAPVALLAAWGTVAAVAAVRTFRWE